MIFGTMILIPKNTRKSLCNSGNYKAIPLSSIFSKLLDWVILIKEEMTLCFSDLQFGFKRVHLLLSSPLLCWKLLITIIS